MKLCGLNREERGSLNNDNVRYTNNDERKQRLARGRVRQCGGGLARNCKFSSAIAWAGESSLSFLSIIESEKTFLIALKASILSYFDLVFFMAVRRSASASVSHACICLCVCFCLSSPMTLLTQERRGYVCSLLTPQCLKSCSAHSRYAVSVY